MSDDRLWIDVCRMTEHGKDFWSFGFASKCRFTLPTRDDAIEAIRHLLSLESDDCTFDGETLTYNGSIVCTATQLLATAVARRV